MLQQEADARLGILQQRYAKAELTDDQDWLDVQMEFQKELLEKNGHPATEANLFALRQAAKDHPEIAFWCRIVDQRVGSSELSLGSHIDKIEAYDLNQKICHLNTNKLVVIASSLS